MADTPLDKIPGATLYQIYTAWSQLYINGRSLQEEHEFDNSYDDRDSYQ